MGDFKGHFGPATFFFLCGIYLFLKASMFKSTESIRYTYFGLLIPGIVGMIGSFSLGFGEFVVSAFPGLHSHQDHFRMNFAVFVLSVVQVLHLSGILKGVFWGLVPTVCFFSVGVLTLQHPQGLSFRHILHSFSLVFYIFLSLTQTKNETHTKIHAFRSTHTHTPTHIQPRSPTRLRTRSPAISSSPSPSSSVWNTSSPSPSLPPKKTRKSIPSSDRSPSTRSMLIPPLTKLPFPCSRLSLSS